MNDFSILNPLSTQSQLRNHAAVASFCAFRKRTRLGASPLHRSRARPHSDSATDHKFNDGEPPVAPHCILDFVQTIMNKVCGLARADAR